MTGGPILELAGSVVAGAFIFVADDASELNTISDSVIWRWSLPDWAGKRFNVYNWNVQCTPTCYKSNGVGCILNESCESACWFWLQM
jgi:hypothetical protein